MELIVVAVVAGVFGTLAMDSLNLLFARVGVFSRIDVAMIGRMAVGWTRGRFRYGHPSEISPVAHELVLGHVAHNTIGVSLAFPYVLGWDLLVGGPAPAIWAVVYGVATTAAAYLFILPSMGLGVFGRLSPQGTRVPLSSLANHLFYGLGLAIGIALL
jgi:hypothetical protein